MPPQTALKLPDSNDKNKGNSTERSPKKWNVPEGYLIQKGKVLPNSSFYTDKNLLSNKGKFKITQVDVWVDGMGIPCLLKFIYDGGNQILEGTDMLPNIPNSLECSSFRVK